MSNQHEPFDVYIMDISYFSGKFEGYLRYKEIPYNRIQTHHQRLLEVFDQTGTMKVPAVRTADNLWLKDSTPMLQWFEQLYPSPSIYPEDPVLGFLAHLLEDFGDEWMWRPAMWWRWEPVVSRYALGRRIANEVLKGFPAPKWLLIHYFAWRQRRTWLWADGMHKGNNEQIRDIYVNQLDALEHILQKQPFLLGSHPSIADFGFFGPYFRHFSNDPDSGELMRQRGPAVYEWTARLWNCMASELSPEVQWSWPVGSFWAPIWREICQAYLPYLHQNAVAWKNKKKRFDFKGGEYTFPKTATTHYRVWCRQELQRHWARLEDAQQEQVKDILSEFGDLEALHLDGDIDSGLDEELSLPFKARPKRSLWTRFHAWFFGMARETKK